MKPAIAKLQARVIWLCAVAVVLCTALLVVSSAQAQNCSIRVTKIDGLLAPDTIGAGDTIVFHLQYGNPYDNRHVIVSNGFKIYSRESLYSGDVGSGSAVWTITPPMNRPFGWDFSSFGTSTGPQVDTNGVIRNSDLFGYFAFRCYGCDGSGSDTIGFAVSAVYPPYVTWLPANDTIDAFSIWIVTRAEDAGKVICIDSTTRYGGSASWIWIGESCGPACDARCWPDWSGPHCFVLAAHSCCVGSTGNVDCSANGVVDITDLTYFIDHLYLNHQALCCPDAADCDGSPGVDIGDLTALIERLYISFASLAPCPQ